MKIMKSVETLIDCCQEIILCYLPFVYFIGSPYLVTQFRSSHQRNAFFLPRHLQQAPTN